MTATFVPALVIQADHCVEQPTVTILPVTGTRLRNTKPGLKRTATGPDQRKGQRNKPLSEARQRFNQGIAKTRPRLEQAFVSIVPMGGR